MAYTNDNILLGAHTSISGGLDKALTRGNELECTAIQIFTKNQIRWFSPPINEEKINLFKEKFLRYRQLKRVVAHASYLINLASRDKEIEKKSIVSISFEIGISIRLGIGLYVLHPGFHVGIGAEEGIKRVSSKLKILTSEYGEDINICVETMAGQGSSLGSNFEEISEILDKAGGFGLGVCFDTCHVFSSGYDIRNREEYEKTMEDFDRVIGIKNLKVIHLNDSKGELGSGIDRHMHIGKGKIGIEAFKLIMNDLRFQGIPKIIETPKEKNPEKYDRMNLELLRSLIND